MYKDTSRFDNMYNQMGNVMYVNHWFGAKILKPESIKTTLAPAKVKKNNIGFNRRGKPMFWLPCLQLEDRRSERLRMDYKIDCCIVMKGKRHPEIYPQEVIELEIIARKDPKKDWRIEIISAFESLTYQRQGLNKWLLIEIGKGYA